jgi:hypothetical protein
MWAGRYFESVRYLYKDLQKTNFFSGGDFLFDPHLEEKRE